MKDSSQPKFIVSSAKNPCPICDCTKDGDCHFNDDVVLCHTSIDADVQKDGYVYRGATDCGLWGQYFPAVETIPKAIRPKATKEFFYPNPDGSPLVRVTRKDDGDGKKTFSQSHWNGQRWVYGLTDEVKAKIHLYRILDPINQQAIANKQPIFIVEGEGVVDALIALRIAATTAIGGAGKWQGYGYQNYIAELKGARVVICPDRDKKGLQHAEAIAADFPNAQWCYAIPESPLWHRIPENGGIDTGDWVTDLKRDGLSDGQVRDHILAAAEPRRIALLTQPNEDTPPPTMEGFDGYLEKLKRLNEIVDPIRKGYEVFAVSKADGYPLRQIEAALAHYRQRLGSKDKTVFELDEFLDLPFVANSWLIEGLVPCGETLILAGAPKEGKTLVAFDAAYCVATNRSKFLGIQPSKKGKVLLISSDESPRSTQARLKKRGFTAEDKGQLRIITRFNLQNLSELREQLVDFPPDLTIVDSLKSISQGSEVSENSAEFADSIYALKELFTQYDSAAILIHHTNKDRDAQGVAQVRGSTAIAGAVWGICVLKTPRRRQGEEPPKDRWLEINPREGERRTLSIELDPSVNTWKVTSSTEQTSPDQATAKDRVVALLKGMNGKGLEFSEIRDLLPDIKRETLSTTLNRLVDSGIAGKQQSETNYKSWVYWMVSSVVSHGFMPVENMVSSSVSPPVSDLYETDHETERNDCQTTLSEVGFTNVPPRVVSHETMSVSHGFMVGSEEEDIDWEVTA